MAAGMKWYFAYGSNMNVARLLNGRLAREGVAMGARIGGRLDDWELAFNKIDAPAQATERATSSWHRARSCTGP